MNTIKPINAEAFYIKRQKDVAIELTIHSIITEFNNKCKTTEQYPIILNLEDNDYFKLLDNDLTKDKIRDDIVYVLRKTRWMVLKDIGRGYWLRVSPNNDILDKPLDKTANDILKKVNIDQEYILCSAIVYHGLIISGYRHSNCYDTLRLLSPETKNSELPDRKHQGFLTSKGRFVNRIKAWKIAKAAHQIKFGPKDFVEAELISENLYDNDCITKLNKNHEKI